MQYRNLGKAGVKVSELALGSWITAGGKYPVENAIAAHKKAFELGINMFDTADAYAAGQAEEIVGRALRELPRHQVVLATKLGFGMGGGANDRGFGRKHLREACEASLKRLGVDYIDLYQAHLYDSSAPLEEQCRGFDDLVRQGKILYWGVSNWSGAQIIEALALCDARGYDRPVSLQPRYNLFARDLEKDQLPVCGKYGLGLVVYSPLSQGLLTGKYLAGVPAGSRGENNANFASRFLTPYNERAVRELRQLAAEAGLTLAQLALAWALRLPEMSAAIVGASQPGQLDETVKASGAKLPDEVLAKIQAALDRRWALVLEEDAAKLKQPDGPAAG